MIADAALERFVDLALVAAAAHDAAEEEANAKDERENAANEADEIGPVFVAALGDDEHMLGLALAEGALSISGAVDLTAELLGETRIVVPGKSGFGASLLNDERAT